MKIAILGFASQGKSAYEYWNKPENEITICDSSTNIDIPNNTRSQLGNNYLRNLEKYDLLIRTPALHPHHIQEANPESPKILDKVWTNTNEFLRVCPTRNIIGITGTKGKGTTSTLVAKMLEATGKKVHLGGNIGTPPLELLKNRIHPQDYIVLELANFQLIDLKFSPRIAVCLMIEPEHLNWHKSLDEYINAKSQLFKNQRKNDIAVYYYDNSYSKKIASVGRGKLIPYMNTPGAYVLEGLTEDSNSTNIVIDNKTICSTNDIKLIGRHNWQNICAAITVVWNISNDIHAIKKVIKNFHGLAHRLEKIRTVNGITYYNDSFSSAPSATIAAIESIVSNKILIIGGVDKHLDLSELARSILLHAADIRKVIIIGEIGDRLQQELESHGFLAFDVLKNVNMPEIVQYAKTLARSGDSVILSPGTSSFDMFKNFEDRGLQFKDAVNKL